MSRTRNVAKPDIADEIRRVQKIQALLIAVHYAANEEAEFDVSDALAVICVLIEQSLAGLDRLEASIGQEAFNGRK
jgi:hypothetical protein